MDQSGALRSWLQKLDPHSIIFLILSPVTAPSQAHRISWRSSSSCWFLSDSSRLKIEEASCGVL